MVKLFDRETSINLTVKFLTGAMYGVLAHFIVCFPSNHTKKHGHFYEVPVLLKQSF